MMHRTQVYFEPEILELLRQEAKEKRGTLASVIREKVKKSVGKKRKKAAVKEKSAAEILLGIAKLGKKLGVKGPRDLSQRIDEFVYR